MVFFGTFLVQAVKAVLFLGVIVAGCKVGTKLHDNKKAKEAA